MKKDQNLQIEYTKNIQDYIQQNQLQEIVNEKELNDHRAYFLPHHAVGRTNVLTTKVRVVFDASSKSENNMSLNQVLHIGPHIQKDLWSQLLQLQTYKYAFSADITQMNRQFQIHPDNEKFQRIVWREGPDAHLKHYSLQTVTFGVASAPFMAIHALHQIGEEADDQIAKTEIQTKFYVDDYLSGDSCFQKAKKKITEVTNQLLKYGLTLTKWISNNKQILNSIPQEKQQMHLTQKTFETSITKTLGVKWDISEDCFIFEMNQENVDDLSKRTFLSQASKTFDPLGLLSPYTSDFKQHFQRLWIEKWDWDTGLPQKWIDYWNIKTQQGKDIQNINIPRYIKQRDTPWELHVFTDASNSALAAAVYIKQNGNTNLWVAQSKVTP